MGGMGSWLLFHWQGLIQGKLVVYSAHATSQNSTLSLGNWTCFLSASIFVVFFLFSLQNLTFQCLKDEVLALFLQANTDLKGQNLIPAGWTKCLFPSNC